MENIDAFIECYLENNKGGKLPLIGKETLLHLAARLEARPDSITKIITAGANVNAFTATNKHTPLHSAALTGNYATISALVNHGADVSVKNSMGSTPFEIFKYNCPKKNLSDTEIQRIFELLEVEQ
jgi:ankyrin repeat protein